MRLLRLRQSNFRNLVTAEFAPGPGLSTLVGGNAQGKTNLLEAIFLALGGELKNGMMERVRFGQSEARLLAEVETTFGSSRLETRLSQGGREVYLNESSASLRELAQLPGAVLLGPEDLELVLGAPEERRRFLDLLLSRFSARYRAILSQYNRALQQRNALLKMGGAGIGVWNQELVKYGSEILNLRRRILGKLKPLARDAYAELAPGELALELFETVDPVHFLQALESGLQDDLQRGVTSVGPHRDDLNILLGGLEAGKYASRGEARSITLALRLAEHRLLWAHHDEAPLLLVDEWHTELDARRRQALLNYAESLPQAILAGLEAPSTGRMIPIEAGVWG
ncbi:MAG: DNA replication and repair protein RecF [Meiothermus sp.]